MKWRRISTMSFPYIIYRLRKYIQAYPIYKNNMSSEKQITIGLLCGGRSGEHQVSLVSAMNIQNALDRDKYRVAIIGIDHSGLWHLSWDEGFVTNREDIEKIALDLSKPIVYPSFGGQLIEQTTQKCLAKIDVFFPITHGSYGEDGTLQGILRSLNVAYVGPDVTGSAIGMDKDVAKRLLRDSGLPITPFMTVRNIESISFEEASTHLGTPLFIKPCRLGSSLGISKVADQASFEQALKKAFQHDRKVLVEQAVNGREIECAVLGNDTPEASDVLGEIVPLEEFYSYEAKYVLEDGAKLQIPAELDPEVIETVRQAAISAFTILECEGMARIDFFVKSNGSFLINEINTLPGFTNISMYPKLWEASGMSQSQLMDRLITLAMERHHKEAQLKNSAES